jgi:hypothetical protein
MPRALMRSKRASTCRCSPALAQARRALPYACSDARDESPPPPAPTAGTAGAACAYSSSASSAMPAAPLAAAAAAAAATALPTWALRASAAASTSSSSSSAPRQSPACAQAWTMVAMVTSLGCTPSLSIHW